MSRKRHRKRGRQKAELAAGKPAIATPPPAEPDPKPTAAELELLEALAVAVAEHRELFEQRDDSYAHLRRVHLAAERVWVLRSSLCFERDQHDAARKAATTANEHARQAARLERDSLADRVAALEAEIDLRRGLSRQLEDLEETAVDDRREHRASAPRDGAGAGDRLAGPDVH